ncbi:MAG: hypothetical protein M3Q03_11705 [Chloroflexota bacterium]|nr:hypothetical protein [Chloroflexota bacterium]
MPSAFMYSTDTRSPRQALTSPGHSPVLEHDDRDGLVGADELGEVDDVGGPVEPPARSRVSRCSSEAEQAADDLWGGLLRPTRRPQFVRPEPLQPVGEVVQRLVERRPDRALDRA